MNLFKQPKIGIVGLGFVGGAIRDNMTDHCELILVDNDPSRGQHTYKDLETCEGIFIAVPSPQGADGKCDTSILEAVLEKLKNYKGVIISKCTAPPSTYEELGQRYPNLVHAPEFLTAANAVRDYANGKFAIIGGTVVAYQREAERVIRLGQHGLKANVEFCSLGEASLAKYAINCFMSTKVIFMNELEKLASVSGLNYNKISSMITMDERIGKSHMQVPGPDGYYGFGGACFPKDTAAMLKYAEEQGAEMAVLNSAVKKNTLLRLTEPK
jgi:nucleotide sugar dehydrogenase